MEVKKFRMEAANSSVAKIHSLGDIEEMAIIKPG